ncbi:MAG: hypothetical protein RL026_38 [Pseudomonadota bacterium]|jgi:general secretion pathway protein A
MYLAFHGLAETPFAITPDPRYLFLGARHTEALAHLVYGLEQAGGFIQLTGEVGTGKTTVVRSLLTRAPAGTEIALILNPRQTPAEFLLSICEELGLVTADSSTGSLKHLVDILGSHLLKAHAAGRRVVLVVDEAQNLLPEVLEQVRLLTNIETETRKLLQILLVGQPELRDLLARHDLRQLAQRITGRYHLVPLTREETAAYVRHRLRVAGAATELFTDGALAELHRRSGGVPRLVNIIADRALLGAYARDRHGVDTALVRQAAGEVQGRRLLPHWMPWALAAGSVVVLAGAGLLGWRLMAERATAPVPEAAPAATAEAPGAAPVAFATDLQPPLGSLLRAPAADTGIDAAWSRLFSLWGARFAIGSEDACTQAVRQGLECHVADGDLALLARFDRPAVLVLGDAAAAHHVVLAGIGPDTVTLWIGERAWQVPRAQLEQEWRGAFLLLWSPDDPDTRPLALGAGGDTVRMLRRKLARFEPSLPTGSDNFDEALQDVLRRFQAAHGLQADGIAGVQTALLLDAVYGPADRPSLRRAGAP